MTTWAPPTLVAQIAMGILFGVLVAIGFVGNILVCVAIYTNKRLRKKENLYFVSLAGADLLLTVLVMPFAAVNDIAGHWIFGGYCKIWMSLDIMCCTCSILHLCSISFDRYYHINDPMLYSERMTGRKILAAILFVWTLSSAIAFVPLSFETHFDNALFAFFINTSSSTTNGNGEKVIQKKLYQCSFNLKPVYAIISSLVSFYLPSIIMIVAYTKLYRYAQRHAQTIRHQLKAAQALLLNASPPAAEQQSNHNHLQPPQPNYQQSRRNFRFRLTAGSCSSLNKTSGSPSSSTTKRKELISSDSKARVTLGAIVGTFLFSWFPFFVCNIVRAFCHECVPDSIFLTLIWMGYANSAQNPIIYSIFNRDFRHAFSRILFCNKRAKRHAGAGNSTFCSVTGNDDLIYANGHATTPSFQTPGKSSDFTHYSGTASTAV